jgi:hypothetical protein
MEARMGTAGRREFIQVLRLMENFHQHQVEQAVSEALRLSAISFDAVKMLLLARLENRPRAARADILSISAGCNRPLDCCAFGHARRAERVHV